MKCFEFGVSSDGSKTLKFTSSEISFIPSDILIKRRMKALKVMEQEVNSQPIMNLLLGKEAIPESGECTSDLSCISLTENQLSVVKKATTNHVSIIQGPPGTGKTHVISAVAYSIIQQYPNERSSYTAHQINQSRTWFQQQRNSSRSMVRSLFDSVHREQTSQSMRTSQKTRNTSCSIK